MFSNQYIEMCRAGKAIIGHFRVKEMFNDANDGMVTPKSIFEVGDYFHHHTMQEGETKIVEEPERMSLRATDMESYPEDECVWIPTAGQIKKGLEEIHWSIGDVMNEDDAERLIVSYMKSMKIKWDLENKEWTEE